MTILRPLARTFALFLAVVLIATSARAASYVQGFMTAPGVTGQGATPHEWDREIVWVSPHGSGTGGGMRMLATEKGWFYIDPPGGVPGGTYTLFTMNLGNIDGGSTGFDVGPDIQVPTGSVPFEGQNFQIEGHYSVLYNDQYTEWGPAPWVWGTDFYQTFVATTTDITRVATKLAGKAGDHQALNLNFAIYETNGGPPSTWTQISPVRTRHLTGGTDPIIHVFDVNYLSSEMTLTPGNQYALRLWRDPSSPSDSFAVVARTDAGDGYAGGQAYVGDAAQPVDLYAYITGGTADTIVNFGPLDQAEPHDGTFATSGNIMGQVFRASGNGLAAVEFMYSKGCSPNPRIFITVQLYDAPGGNPIGPAKRMYTVTDLCQGRVAAFWPRGEAPLTPGQDYYIEFDATEGGGISAWRLKNNIPNAHAILNGAPQATADLAMTIGEYATGDVPTPGPSPTPTNTPVPTSTPTPIIAPNLLQNGDMEDGQTGTGGHTPDHWEKWTGSGSPTWWFNDYGRNGTLGARLIGGSINGTTFDAGLYQQVSGLNPGQTYGLTGWVSIVPALTNNYEAWVGVDPTGQTSNGLAGTVTYTRTGGNSQYAQMPVQTFTASGSTATVWLRARTMSTDSLYHADFDDLHLFVYAPGPTATPTPSPTPSASRGVTFQTY